MLSFIKKTGTLFKKESLEIKAEDIPPLPYKKIPMTNVLYKRKKEEEQFVTYKVKKERMYTFDTID